MTNIVNTDRDMFWAGPYERYTMLASDMAGDDVRVSTSLAVAQVVASVQGNRDVVAGTGLECYTVGVEMLPPPLGDSVPYRVKAACVDTALNPIAYGFGYKPSGDNLVENYRMFASGLVCDEMVVIDPLIGSDPNFGDPLCFFVSVLSVAASSVRCGLSVQRLISVPPRFASAVS